MIQSVHNQERQSQDCDIAVIGAGYCGSTTIIHQINYFIEKMKEANQSGQQNDTATRINIKLIEKSGAYGTGTAYSEENGDCLLNQNTDAMSPFPNAPDHFTQWLNKHGYETKVYDGREFVERRVYGIYLQDILEERLADAKEQNLNISIEKVNYKIDDIAVQNHRQHSDYTLSSACGHSIHAKSVVFATGHVKSNFLQEFEGSPHYSCGVCETEKVKDFVARDKTSSRKHNRVLVVGTGQSMMDHVVALKRHGYEGKVYAVSRTQVEPWCYNPDSYTDDGKPPYKLQIFTSQLIKKNPNISKESLYAILNEEFNLAKGQGYDVGHVLSKIRFQQFKPLKKDTADVLAVKKRAYDICMKVYGNPTCPEKFKVYQEMRDSGQLKFVQGEVTAQNMTIDQDVVVQGLAKRNKKARFDHIFNGASFDRNPAANPIVQKAIGSKIIVQKAYNLIVANARAKGAYLAGMLFSPEKWGVESFRQNNIDIAKASIDYALSYKQSTLQPQF
jgi:hypothetical protein